jgi:competence protein ComGC
LHQREDELVPAMLLLLLAISILMLVLLVDFGMELSEQQIPSADL